MKSYTFELHNYAAVLTPNIASMPKNQKGFPSSRSEKYSLRQRQKRRNTHTLSDEPSSSTGFSSDHSSCTERQFSEGQILYNNRNTIIKQQNRSSRTASTPASKSKSKPAPLSKYRRKTANARERTRMREINCAFENLRYCVPQAITGDDTSSSNEKLTKITTLRLAMRYISLLSDALDNPCFEADFLLECLRDADERRNNQAPPTANEEYTTVPTVPTPKTRSAKLTANTPKSQKKAAPKIVKRRTNSRQHNKFYKHPSTAQQSPESVYCSSSLTSSSNPTPVSSPLSAYNTLHSYKKTPDNASSYYSVSHLPTNVADAPPLHAFTKLHTMLLESDGESLNFSENCFSPNVVVQSNYDGILASSTVNSTNQSPDLNPTSELYQGDLAMTSAMQQADIELSLQLMESSAENFDFGTDHQPSDCISPLVTLDSFNSFSDLLHTDFTEDNNLDLFLT